MAEKKFTIDITENLAWKYELSPTLTPEELAEIVVCSYYSVRGDVYGPMLEANGHENGAERFEIALKAMIDKVGQQAIDQLKEKYLEKVRKEEPAVSPLDAFEHGKRIAYDMPGSSKLT